MTEKEILKTANAHIAACELKEARELLNLIDQSSNSSTIIAAKCAEYSRGCAN